MKLALVGATGLVGEMMIRVLEERKIKFNEFYPVASSNSVGKSIVFNKKEYKIISIDELLTLKPDVALFSAGSEISKQYAQKLSDLGCFVIDNSSAWRMNEQVPLVVPEVNNHQLRENSHIIANPNCSTIQLVVALAPLHKKYKIRRLVISTYQSVTGTGIKAVNQLNNERSGKDELTVYPYKIDMNCFPHGGDFLSDGSTTEEAKLLNETRKILEDNTIQVTSTVVRIPVVGGHSEAINVEFEHSFELEDILSLLKNSTGIVVQDEPSQNLYPMPITAHNKDAVFVGRIRRDNSIKNGLNLWVVSDNLRKGAATNAVQILESLLIKGLVF